VFKFKSDANLVIERFESADSAWFEFVLSNRGLAKETVLPKQAHADIIIGPVANDAVGIVLNQFIIGTYGDPSSWEAKNTAIRLLQTQNLHNQVFFGTVRAIECLGFMEAYHVAVD